MALTPFDNGEGFLLRPYHEGEVHIATTLNAAGESCALIGEVWLSTGPGTSKVLSAAGGGKIAFATDTVTFGNAGTTLRVGINDLLGAASGGVEDGTHDVYADLVGGTDTIPSNGIKLATMTSGSKTIAHGDKVAIVCEMTARQSPDTVGISRRGENWLYPFCTQDTGTLAKTASGHPLMTIVFDDGTLGKVSLATWAMNEPEVSGSFNTGTTPDEYAMIFRVPVAMRVKGLWAYLDAIAVTDDFELILYSDPLGSPVAEHTISQDCDLVLPNGNNYEVCLTAYYDLDANVDYAVALRPTTANSVSFYRLNFGSGNADVRKATVLGTNWYQASRSNQSGAFGSADTTRIPLFGVRVSHLHDAGGFAGGGFSYTGIHQS